MKKFLLKFLAVMAIFLSGFAAADAQIIVKVRPGAPVIRARPLSPGPRHIWVGDEYVWRGGTYVYTDGYWAVPPSRFRVWKEGHWKRKPAGWVWIPGHWAR